MYTSDLPEIIEWLQKPENKEHLDRILREIQAKHGERLNESSNVDYSYDVDDIIKYLLEYRHLSAARLIYNTLH